MPLRPLKRGEKPEPKPESKPETPLQKTEPQPLATIPDTPVGQENIQQEDLIIPRVVLVQPVSQIVKEDIEPGLFYRKLTAETFEKPQLLIFYHKKQRILFEERGSNVISCRSFDGKIGIQNLDCSDCQRSMWLNEEGERKEKGPECQLMYCYFCFVINSETPEGKAMPSIISLARTSLFTGRELNSRVKMNRMQWFSRIWEMHSEPGTVGGYNYFVSKLKDLRPATSEEQQVAFAAYNNLIVPGRYKEEEEPAEQGESEPGIPF